MPGLSQQVPSARILCALALLAAAIVVTPPASASAVDYKVEVCTRASTAADGVPASAGDGIVTQLVGETGPISVNNCDVGAADSGALHQGSPGGTAHEESEGFWRLLAPAGAKIVRLALTQEFHHAGASFLHWALFTGSGATLFSYFDDGRAFFPPTERVTYAVNSGMVEGSLFCEHLPGGVCSGAEFTITAQDVVAVLDDESAPSFVGAPSLPSPTVRGTSAVRYSAVDPGSGIASVHLVVDGKAQPAVHDDNGGHCQEPFKYVVPCRQSLVDASLPLDTQGLADGRHQVQVAVTDATGQESVSAPPLEFAVRNAPANSARPLIRGVAAVGGLLSVETGRWVGSPTEYRYRWLRCPAAIDAEGDSGGCAPIAGASASQYVLAPADVGQRVLVEVIAVNAAGSGSATSVPSDLIAAAPTPPALRPQGPVLSRVTLSRKRFRVGSARPSRGRGTVLSFSSTRAGHLSLVIERVRGHSKAKPISKLGAAIKPGRSSVLLSGELGKGRRLAPGDYQVTLTVRDAKGLSSEPVSVPFKILPG